MDEKEKESSVKNFIKQAFTSEARANRITYYFAGICVLLVVVIVQLNYANRYLKRIASGGNTYNFAYSSVNEEGETLYYDIDGATVASTTENDPYQVFTVASSTAFFSKETSTTVNTKETEKTTTASSSQSVHETPSNTSNVTNETTGTTKPQSNSITYVINKSSKKIHYADCSFAKKMNPENKLVVKLTYTELQEQYLSQGYTFCSRCLG